VKKIFDRGWFGKQARAWSAAKNEETGFLAGFFCLFGMMGRLLRHSSLPQAGWNPVNTIRENWIPEVSLRSILE
jgi:hypothetical protein